MDENNNWRYCVVGNIVRTRIDKDGIFRYGTSAFTGGTKVYLSRNFFEYPRDEISVIGLNRFKRYQVVEVTPECIENIRCSKTYKPSVLSLMSDWEFLNCWWDNTPEDKRSAEEFVRRWKASQSMVKRLRVYISPAEHFRDSAYYEFLADFENPYLVGKYMAHLRLNEKYREQDLILGEIFAKKIEAGEIITKGDVVAVLSTMGEYLPLEEYEFI